MALFDRKKNREDESGRPVVSLTERLKAEGEYLSDADRPDYATPYVRPKRESESEEREKFSESTQKRPASDGFAARREQENVDEGTEVISRVQNRLRQIFGDRINKEGKNLSFREELGAEIENALKQESQVVTTVEMREQYKKHIFNLLLGFGPLEELFDKGYSEIEVARYDKIFVEENGAMKQIHNVRFRNEDELVALIKARIAEPVGRSFDSSHPILDARLEDGSRVNAVLYPIALDGTQLTIRRFPPVKINIDDYLRFSTIDQRGLDIIDYCVRAKATIIVSGGTGSGKTTLLNVISNMLSYDPGQAVITIEDTAELQLNHPNVRRKETKSGNGEADTEITTTDLIKNSMRERPDRVIIGEIRDGAMADFLRIANSGHEGGFTTVHNNSPYTMEGTMQLLVQMSDSFHLSEQMVRFLYGNGVDIIIQIRRFPDKVRRITHITHVVGYGMDAVDELSESAFPVKQGDVSNDKVYLRDIYKWERLPGKREDGKINGHFVTTGYIPKAVIERGDQYGAPLKEGLFGAYDSAKDGE